MIDPVVVVRCSNLFSGEVRHGQDVFAHDAGRVVGMASRQHLATGRSASTGRHHLGRLVGFTAATLFKQI